MKAPSFINLGANGSAKKSDPFSILPLHGDVAEFFRCVFALRKQASVARGLKPASKADLGNIILGAVVKAAFDGSKFLSFEMEMGEPMTIDLDNLDLKSFLVVMDDLMADKKPDDEGGEQKEDLSPKHEVERKDAQPAEAQVAVTEVEVKDDGNQEESEFDRMVREQTQ